MFQKCNTVDTPSYIYLSNACLCLRLLPLPQSVCGFKSQRVALFSVLVELFYITCCLGVLHPMINGHIFPYICRKESLRVLRKMCRYLTKEWLAELCEEVPSEPQRPPFIASISEVLAAVLENEVSQGNPPLLCKTGTKWNCKRAFAVCSVSLPVLFLMNLLKHEKVKPFSLVTPTHGS